MYLKIKTKDAFQSMEEPNSNLRVMVMLAFNPTKMIANHRVVTYLLSTMVQSIGRVSKQSTTTQSTTKAEYIFAFEAANEGVWIRKFIIELGVVPSIVNLVTLYCDNNGAIMQAKEPRSHQRSKHVLRRYHLIRDIIVRGDISIEKVLTEKNLIDPLTKVLSQQKHDRHMKDYGIRYKGDWLQC